MQGQNMRFAGIRQFSMGKAMLFLGLFFIAGLFLTAFLSELMPMVFPGMETVANLKLTSECFGFYASGIFDGVGCRQAGAIPAVEQKAVGLCRCWCCCPVLRDDTGNEHDCSFE